MLLILLMREGRTAKGLAILRACNIGVWVWCNVKYGCEEGAKACACRVLYVYIRCIPVPAFDIHLTTNLNPNLNNLSDTKPPHVDTQTTIYQHAFRLQRPAGGQAG